jgi:hypothetical protein
MEDEHSRPTEPGRALVPPRRRPPTAVATATPGPAPEHKRRAVESSETTSWTLLSRALDVVDELADAVAEALNLRRGRTTF